MKTNTEKILNLVESEEIENISEEVDVEEYDGVKYEDVGLRESLVELDEVSEVLEKAVDSGIIDQLPASKRKSILGKLRNIKNNYSNFKSENRRNRKNNKLKKVLSSIDQLRSLVVSLELRDRLEKSGEIDYAEKISELKGLREELDQVEETSEELNELKDGLENLESELDKAVQEAKSETKDITDKSSKSQTKFNSISDKESKIAEMAENSRDLANEINQLNDSIKDKDQRLDKNLNRVDNLKNETEDLESKLNGLLGDALEASLGVKFDERKDQIEDSIREWKIASYISIAALVIFSGIIFVSITLSESSGVSMTLSKIAILIPVSVAVWFTTSNYKKNRALMEAYAFKYTISRSLDGFREIIEKDIPDNNEEEVIRFLQDSMDKIYEDPTNLQSETNNPRDKIFDLVSRG